MVRQRETLIGRGEWGGGQYCMIPERRVLWITCRLKSVPYHFASLHAVSGSI